VGDLEDTRDDEGGNVKRRETDEEVRTNLPPTLHELFRRVAGGIKGNARQTRTEVFLEYVEEHPGEEAESASTLAEWRLKAALRPMLDFYETPSWAIRAIVRTLVVPEGARILDPGCGTGAILRELGALFPENEVVGLEKEEGRFRAASASTDLPVLHGDFFTHHEKWDLIVSNPPYSHVLEFVQHALTLAPIVCMLLRLPWIASQSRAQWHRENLAQINVLPKRPSFTADGKTDATEYAWFVWGTKDAGTYTILEIDPNDVKKRAA
jgi:SAM-dependent methyltransferase